MPSVPVHANWGAVFDGVTLSTILYGVASAQTIMYFRSYPNDRRIVKYLVGFLWLVDSVQTALTLHMFWHYFIRRDSVDPSFFHFVNWSLIGQVVPSEICVVAVESFFIVRLWILSNKNSLTLIPILPMLIGWASSFTYVVGRLQEPVFGEKIIVKLTLIAIPRTVTDVSIAIIMCVMLYQRKDEFVPRTRSLLKALIILTLTTGVLTSIFTIAYVVMYLSMQNMIYIGTYFVHEKIYVNSMLAALNTRESLRTIADADILISELTGPPTPASPHP